MQKKVLLIFIACFLVVGRFFLRQKEVASLYKDISRSNNIVTLDAKVISSPVNLSVKRKIVVKGLGRGHSYKILLTTQDAPFLYYGDIVSFKGKLLVPPEFEDFSYRDYLATKGIFAFVPQATVSLIKPSHSLLTALSKGKEQFARKLYQIYPRREAILTLGMLLGIDNAFPKDFKDQLREAGLLHLVVVSGGNLVFILTLFYKSLLFFRLKRFLAFLIGSFSLLVYSFVVGFEPPVVRALIMTLIALFAYTNERKVVSLQLLGFTAFVMLLINPYLLLSASFQLSILATFGLVALLPRLSSFLRKRGWLNFVTEAGATTVSAQLAVLPVILLSFGKVNLVKSVLSNILVSFVPALVTYLGLLSGILGFLWLPLGRLVGWFNYLLLRYFLFVVKVFS